MYRSIRSCERKRGPSFGTKTYKGNGGGDASLKHRGRPGGGKAFERSRRNHALPYLRPPPRPTGVREEPSMDWNQRLRMPPCGKEADGTDNREKEGKREKHTGGGRPRGRCIH